MWHRWHQSETETETETETKTGPGPVPREHIEHLRLQCPKITPALFAMLNDWRYFDTPRHHRSSTDYA